MAENNIIYALAQTGLVKKLDLPEIFTEVKHPFYRPHLGVHK
jgi:hypothetical protein